MRTLTRKKYNILHLSLTDLEEKEGRYVSQKLFLTFCISENVILNDLRLELEPTVGNQDETFFNNWF